MQYKKETLTINITKANLVALALIIPIFLVSGIPYFLLWHDNFTLEAIKAAIRENKEILHWSGVIVIGVMIVGIVIHELIHGIIWALFAKNGWRSIKFGVMWKMLTPYCHCKEPLTVRQYIIGGIMPAIVLGFIPSIVSIFSGSFPLFLFGLFFTVAAAGDFMIINLLKNEDMDSLVEDHPSEAGCYIYRPITQEEVIA